MSFVLPAGFPPAGKFEVSGGGHWSALRRAAHLPDLESKCPTRRTRSSEISFLLTNGGKKKKAVEYLRTTYYVHIAVSETGYVS